MYQPQHFKEERLPVLHQAIQEAGLATLVTLGTTGLEASHIPLLLDPTPGSGGTAPYGTLYGHLARGNQQWTRFATGTEALAIFLGPDAYVSPSWYATKAETGKVVPTWNYIAIHAYGPLQIFEDAASLLDVVTRLTQRHENGRAKPWAVTDAPADFIQAHLKGIIGFTLPITRLEGKWKMSQNRPAPDRVGVAVGLAEDGKAEAASVMTTLA